MTIMNFPRTVAGRIDELTAARSLLRERLAGKAQTRDSGFVFRPNPQSPTPNPGFRGDSFRRLAPKGNGRAIFPIRRGAALVPVELAKLAHLRHHVRASLILPLMVAGAGQGLLRLRHNGVIDVHQQNALFNYLPIALSVGTNIALMTTGGGLSGPPSRSAPHASATQNPGFQAPKRPRAVYYPTP